MYGESYHVGPKLSEIGSKLPKDAILDAVVHPSQVSALVWAKQLNKKDGSGLTRIILSKTESGLDTQYPGVYSNNKVRRCEVYKGTAGMYDAFPPV